MTFNLPFRVTALGMSLYLISLFTFTPLVNLHLPRPVTVYADTTSAKYAGTVVDGADGQNCAWLNPSNAQGNDTNTLTRCEHTGLNTFTNRLIFTNFGFTSSDIPVGSTINGVTVELEWNATRTDVVDSTVQLTLNGSTATGSNNNNGNNFTTKTIDTFGGTSDTWGLSLSQSDLVSSNFGFVLQYFKNTGGPTARVSVYRARVTVTYTPPVAIAISLNTDGNVAFGLRDANTTIDTTGTGINDVEVISIDSGPADLDVKSSNFSDGSNTWSLAGSSGHNTVHWQFSPDGSSWTTFAVADSLYSLASNVAQSSTQNLYLKLTTPTSTSSYDEHSTTVTIVASAP